MEFKTVTDLDRWFRENVQHILDQRRLGKLSYYGIFINLKALDIKWQKYHKQITRGD